ncbi:unnamed protein product [Caenorhabditis angaria]|uniref:Uncharacterized protein n=1 Tax=Caenorhabditis angaria TaxID=860376 RepID=A0A9P1I594_9PELO|nr:unnamed protein product [Caenorhabditis angaria]
MDTLETLFSNNAYTLAALSSTSGLIDEDADVKVKEEPEEEEEDHVDSDDDMKIDFSAAIMAATNALATMNEQNQAQQLLAQQKGRSISNVAKAIVAAANNKQSIFIPPIEPSSSTSSPPRKQTSRPDRGKFTILDDMTVAEPEEVLDVEFNPEMLQKIFADPKLGQHLYSIQFLARFGLIPNTRVCRVPDCPKDQLMSLIKHANGFVWRCRSCRKRREKKIITKISVYEGTFLFYSRMPLNKFFIFMLVWCENPGLSISEYNKLMGENRLVEETIYNTIGFMRDIIQNWCDSFATSFVPIGGPERYIEMVETMSTEQLSSKTRNRRTRHYTTRTVFISLADNKMRTVDATLNTVQDLERALLESVEMGSVVLMKDSLLERFGTAEEVSNTLCNHYKIRAISDCWPNFDVNERNRQFLKTQMNQIPNASQEPYAYEYFFRRCFQDKCFNHLLRVIRLLYTKS